MPTMSIGASFGCVVGIAAGFAPSLYSLRSGSSVCRRNQLSGFGLMIALELFGYDAMPYFAVIVAVSFTLSGYYGIYSSQKFVYSKTRTEFINRKAN